MNPQNSHSLVSGNPYLDCPRKNDVTFLWNTSSTTFGGPPSPDGKATLSGTSCHLSQRARLTTWRVFLKPKGVSKGENVCRILRRQNSNRFAPWRVSLRRFAKQNCLFHFHEKRNAKKRKAYAVCSYMQETTKIYA